MRKVKFIVEEFKSGGATVAALEKVMREFLLGDIMELQRVRNARSDEALHAIFNEVEERFRSFALQVPPLSTGLKLEPRHFGMFLKEAMPDVYQLWQVGKMREMRRRSLAGHF